MEKKFSTTFGLADISFSKSADQLQDYGAELWDSNHPDMPPKSKRGKQTQKRATPWKNQSRKKQAPRSSTRFGGSNRSGRGGSTISRAPAYFTRTPPTRNPVMSHGPDGSLRVRHHEMVQDTVTDVANVFQLVHGFYINPGSGALFPWLSSIAAQYEMYQFNSLSFEYKTQCTTANTGNITFAIDYDANDDYPTSREDLFNYEGSKYTVPWSDMAVQANPSRMRSFAPWHYVGTNVAIASGETRRENHVGFFYGYAQGVQGSTNCGTLFVTYDVTLRIPQLSRHAIAQRNSAMSTSTGTVLATPLLGTVFANNGLNCDVNAAGTQFLFFVPGEFTVAIEGFGATFVAGSDFAVAVVGANTLLTFDQLLYIPTSASQGVLRFRIKIPVASSSLLTTTNLAGFSLNLTGDCAALTSVGISVSPWPYDVPT